MVLTTTLNHNSNIGSVHIIIQLYSQTQTQPLSSSYVNTNGQTVTLRNNNINPTTVKLQYPIYTAKRDETVLSHRVSWCKLGTGLTLTGVILPRWWFPAGADICGWQMSGDDDVDRYGIVHCLVRRRRLRCAASHAAGKTDCVSHDESRDPLWHQLPARSTS